MRLHFIVTVDPEDSDVRSAHSDTIRESLESEIESIDFEVDGNVYLVAVLGSGKTADAADESMRLRMTGR